MPISYLGTSIRDCPAAERNPHYKTKDMSFTIKTNASSAFATSGLQERRAHDRQQGGRKLVRAATHQELLGDSCDLTHIGTGAAAIREEAAFQARLSEHLSFLQTQDAALGQIQDLLANSSDHEDFLDNFEALTGEKFNGLDLFTHEGEEQPLYVSGPENQDAFCIHRPLVSVECPVTALQEAVRAAREENQKEQARLREISASIRIQAPVRISDTDSARETIFRSQRHVLSDAFSAISGQANSAHDSVLRLFS